MLIFSKFRVTNPSKSDPLQQHNLKRTYESIELWVKVDGNYDWWNLSYDLSVGAPAGLTHAN